MYDCATSRSQLAAFGQPRILLTRPIGPYAKHSSGDLHSRLKTRKILGVGETDNGDIHRSKISQLLGHNEHLYVKFPRGFWIWHLILAMLVTVQGIMALLLPHHFHMLILQQPIDGGPDATFATRLSGATLLGMSIFVWSIQGTTEKAQARTSLAAITMHMLLQIIVNVASVWQHGNVVTSSTLSSLGTRTLIVLVSIFYHNAIGRSTAGLRKSSSYKDLTTPEKNKESSSSTSAKEDTLKVEEKKEN